MNDLKVKYRDFEKVHESCHEGREEVKDIEESDTYLIQVQDSYSDALAEANAWLDSQVKQEEPEQPKASTDTHRENIITPELLTMLNLPKVELDCFDGNPLQYHSFMTVFDDTVDKVVREGTTKLTRMLQYTSGAAKEAIRSCAIMGGEKGYELARRILHERFGNDLLISEKTIAALNSGKPVRSASDLQALSNELVNCNITLTRMGSVQEINSQRFIASIVDRIPCYFMAGRRDL
jgi:hypothetical protein